LRISGNGCALDCGGLPVANLLLFSVWKVPGVIERQSEAE